MTRKSDNYVGKVPNDSTVYAANDAGSLNSRAVKENYQCIRQGSQKKDANVSNCDLKNLDFLQVNDVFDDDTLNKKLPSAVDVVLSSKSAATYREKLIPKDLSRNKSAGSLHGSVSGAQGSLIGSCAPQSKVDDMLDDDTLNEKLPSPVDVVLSSKSAPTYREKLVPKDLSRNKSPGSLQGSVSAAQGSPKGSCAPQSKVDGVLDDDTLNKELPSPVDFVLSSKSAATYREKLVPKDLSRNKSPGSLQGSVSAVQGSPNGSCAPQSKVDGVLDDDTLNKELPSPVDFVLSSKSAATYREKLVPKDLSRNKSPGSLQGSVSAVQGSPIGRCDPQSKVDAVLDDDTLHKKLPSPVDFVLSLKSAATYREKLVPKDLSRNKSPGSLQGSVSVQGSPIGSCDPQSEVDGVLDDDTLNKKLPSPVDVVLSSKSAATYREKLVPKDLSRNKSAGSLQGSVSAAQGSPIGSCAPQLNDAVGSAGGIAGKNSPIIRYQRRNKYVSSQPSKYQPPISSALYVVRNAGKNIVNRKALPGIPEEDCGNAAAASKLLSPGDKALTLCCPQNDFRSICWAVNEAYWTQLAAESIEMVKGYPVAEFEKFLRSASPVICPSVTIRTCQAACIRGQGVPLCIHEIPDISLGKLWEWYEKHGNYGLEVKAEELVSSQRHGVGRLKFSAYFVPSLSAVQLFKYSKTLTSYKDDETIGSIDVADSVKNDISGSSPTVDLSTVFPELVPQSRVENSSSIGKRNVVSGSRSSSDRSNTDLHHPPVESDLSGDNMELLFEYFEHEQPQIRKPLFLKIQELAAGMGPSSHGDPSVVLSTRLPDLHPHSWYCVAWYPIYRIPNGNFRAAFLTYHSLGHYVHKGQTLAASSPSTSVVSPTVGLQSYNAKGECWFQPRHSMYHQKQVTLDSDPPSVVRARLKTLEQTACRMSRAMRTNGAETLMNRHSDYEFFMSRRRGFIP